MSLQHLEMKGGALQLLCGLECNPVLKCLQQYGDMLTKPLETNLAVLFKHFEDLDDVEYAVFVDAVRAAALSVAVRIWRYILVLFFSWPYKLANLTHADPQTRENTEGALANARDCCLDRAMSRKAKKLLIGQRRGLLTAIRAWARTTLVTNMVTERLLALIRRSAEKKCVLARLLSGGFLTQILPAHLKAGGEDVRNVTRRKLLRTGALIRAAKGAKRGSSAKVKAPSRQTEFARWANARQVG